MANACSTKKIGKFPFYVLSFLLNQIPQAILVGNAKQT
jgi:hypothetical protein